MALLASSKPPHYLSKQVTASRWHYFSLKPRTGPRLEIVCIGREICTPDYQIDRSTFPYLALEFVAAGSGMANLAGRTLRLKPGTTFAYGPGVPHRLESDSDQPLVKYFVNFIGLPARGLLHKSGIAPGTGRQLAIVGDIREAFDRLLLLAANHGKSAAHVCALELEILLFRIAHSHEPASPAERRARTTFERVRSYLDTQFLHVNSVAEVARGCSLDSSHLSRLFRRFGQEPPLKYLQRRKMQWAAERLHHPACLVRHVAEELGTDPFSFSRMFKRVYGLAPSEFQRGVS